MKYFFTILTTVLLFPQVVFALPNDPRVEQWGYAVTHVYDAWDITTGSKDVVVAVIDNGFDHFHSDLIDNVWINTNEIPRNGIDDDHNGYIDDIYGWNFVPEDFDRDGALSSEELLGNNNPRPQVEQLTEESKHIIHHGTLVAGIIGAKGNNGLYGAGLNWDVSLMNLKIVGNDGNGSLAQLARAIRYAVDNGADVISMSIIGGLTPEDIDLVKEAVQYAYDHDVVLVAAAGNTATNLNESPLYPVCADAGFATTTIIGTTAVMEGRRFAVFSNYGSRCIDITAPGHEIASTLRYAPNSGLTLAYDGGYQGTSFAVPFISGTAALIRSVRPDLSADQVIESILNTTSKTPPENEALYANLFGRGLVQVAEAIRYAQALPIHPGNYERSIRYNGIVYSFDTTGALVDRVAAPLIYTADTRTQVQLSSDGLITTTAQGRRYTWTIDEPEDVVAVYIDDTYRTTRVVVVKHTHIDWYTVDGWNIRTIHTRGIFDARYTDGLETIEQTISGDLEHVQYDKGGVIVSRSKVATTGRPVAAVFGAGGYTYIVAIPVVGTEKIYDVYGIDMSGISTNLSTYTAARELSKLYIIPNTQYITLIETEKGTVYDVGGMFKGVFTLE